MKKVNLSLPMSRTFDVKQVRNLFPFFHQNQSLVYFDNAATSQKPQLLIDAINQFYTSQNANVHRGAHQLSQNTTILFEQTRAKIKQYVNAAKNEEIIFTKGATEAINLIAHGLSAQLNPDDEILISAAEHHANIVPWQQIAKQRKAVIKVIPLARNGTINQQQFQNMLTAKTKVVAVSHMSNVVGKFNDIKHITALCQQQNIITVVDGAQAIAHSRVDVQELGCDFYVFSAHKVFGPTGLGILYGKQQRLAAMPPYQSGGEMIKKVSFFETSFADLPFKFEAGTPNIEAIVSFAAVIDWLLSTEAKNYWQYEQELTNYLYLKLTSIVQLELLFDDKPDVPLVSFNVKGWHHQDLSILLDQHNILVRSGHHCAMPLIDVLGLKGCVRASLSFYNSFTEIDYFIDVLKKLVFNPEYTTEKGETAEQHQQHAKNEIVTAFAKAKSWDQRHRQIMLFSKQLAPLSNQLKNEENLVQGCESNAWLVLEKQGDRYIFKADSDTKVIRGLLYILLAAINNCSSDYIQQFDFEHYFKELGLNQHLSPSRGNGVLAIIARIKELLATS